MLTSLIVAAMLGVEPPQIVLPVRPGYGMPASPVRTRTVVTYRAAVGHTHTCINGHTWDHQANPTHTCQFCGQQQWVQDRFPGQIRIVRTERVTTPRVDSSSISERIRP